MILIGGGGSVVECNRAINLKSFLARKKVFGVNCAFLDFEVQGTFFLDEKFGRSIPKLRDEFCITSNLTHAEDYLTNFLEIPIEKIYSSKLGLSGIFALDYLNRNFNEPIYLLGFDFDATNYHSRYSQQRNIYDLRTEEIREIFEPIQGEIYNVNLYSRIMNYEKISFETFYEKNM